MSDFNYDSNDPELDEYGLPIYTEGEDEETDSASTSDLIDLIKQARAENGEDEDDEEDENDNSGSRTEKPNKKEETETGGRYGDKTSPADKLKDTTKPQPPTQTPTTQGSGGDFFSKMIGKGGSAGASAGKVAGGAKVAGATTTSTATAAGTAGGSSVLASIAPAIPWILLVLLIIIVIIVVICAISAFIANKTDPANMSSNTYITSEYFYGIRTVYIDDEALSNSLQLSYKQYTVDVLNVLNENPNITINITLPTEFDNTTAIDQHITNISLGIGNIVANNLSDYNVDFATLYPNIEYFGITPTQSEIINTFMANYFVDNNVVTITGSDTIETLITSAISSENLQYIYNICEKVMIKDEIATAEGLSNIEQRKYIATIYMPNKDITITSAVYTIVNQSADFTTSVKLIEENNNIETTHLDKSIEDSTDIISSDGKNFDVKKFTSIDTENTNLFSSGLSLFNALKLAQNKYFEQNSDGIYTWKPVDPSLAYLSFNSVDKFIYTEFDLNVKATNQ